ncbi:hypothetical protein FBU30_002924 [Linnemannia zychae]|nr:hypothetical protein FBU30_002924 [Linnemannia zychae]
METCPPELTIIIASLLTSRELCSCTCVSKFWSRVFTPLLWRTVRIASKSRNVNAIPMFAAAILRHGQHIQELTVESYHHLKYFLLSFPAKNDVDNYASLTGLCVRNLKVLRLIINETKTGDKELNILRYPSTSPTPIFAFSLDVDLEHPPLLLQLLKNNPGIHTLYCQGYNIDLEWLYKHEKVLGFGPLSLSPPSTFAQLVPSLKRFVLKNSGLASCRLFCCQPEPIARFLSLIPDTLEKFTLYCSIEDVTMQGYLSNLLPLEPPNLPRVGEHESRLAEPPSVHPLAISYLGLSLHSLSDQTPAAMKFFQSLSKLLLRCVHLRELVIDISKERYVNVALQYILDSIEKLQPKMLTSLRVYNMLEDATLARLLDCARNTGCNSNTIISTELLNTAATRRVCKSQPSGWKTLTLSIDGSLGPMASSALIAHTPTLKSLDIIECYSCPSKVLATILSKSPELEFLDTIRDIKSNDDDWERFYNFVDARDILETLTATGDDNKTEWSCIRLKRLKAVISNVPRPDCLRSHFKARLSPSRNGTQGLIGDIEMQALHIQRTICCQLGKLTQLRILWLGYETRDFKNLANHRVIPDERRRELGLPKRDPNDRDNLDKNENDNGKDEGDEEEDEQQDIDADTDSEREEEEEEEEEGDEDDYDFDAEDEVDLDEELDENGNMLMYPLMFLNPLFQFSCLPLTLESGLDLMSELKELRELNVEQMAHRIGLKEVQFMAANWPKLNRIIGLNGYDETVEAVEWLKKSCPWIDLPVSVNSMRQSTWLEYYPSMRGY